MCRGNDRPPINLSNDDVGRYVIAFADAFSFGAVTVVAATMETLMACVISPSLVRWTENYLPFYV